MPSFPVVEAKLRPPLLPSGVVSRARLIERLTAEPRKPVISVVAPAGYGKTLLLSELAARDPADVAWLTIDGFDNDATVLFTYLTSAIDRVEPVGDAMSGVFTAAGSQILRAAVPRLAAELHGWRRPGLLVMDDVHKLTDPTCLDAVSGLLDHLPAGFQVALLARRTPDLQLDRLRANRQLLELGPADLALDDTEAETLVKGSGQPVSAAQARALVERTEGWAAAIYLSTLDRQTQAARLAPDDNLSGSDGFIYGYLRSALEPGLGERDLAVLTRCSILEVIEPAAAEVISGMAGASDRLRILARENQLITRLGGTVEVYRYHGLLRDYLLKELLRREPDAVPALHRRAATWFEDTDRPSLAIEHAFAGGDVDTAARLLTSVAVRLHYQGQDDRLERWLRRFSEDDYAYHPGLAIVAAWLHAFLGRAELAERMADIAERSTFDGPAGDGAASFASSRALIRSVLMRHGTERALVDAEAAVAAEQPGSVWRMTALNLAAIGRMLKGEREAADDIWRSAVDSLAEGAAVPYFPLACRAQLAIERGDWSEADRLAQLSHDALHQSGIGLIVTTLTVHAVCARVAAHHNDQRRVAEELAHAQLVRPQATYAMPSYAVWPMLELARTYLAIGDPAGARSVISQAERIVQRRPDVGVLNAQLRELRQRVDEAARSLSGPSTLTPSELRLLPYLSTYLTFDEIGKRLAVTRHTVKAHALAIYGKLEVSGRGEAVERAIEIGLLEPFPGLEIAVGLR